MYNFFTFETENNKYIFDNISGEVFYFDELFLDILNNYKKYKRDDLIKKLSCKYDINDINSKCEYVEQLISQGFFYRSSFNDIRKKENYEKALLKGFNSQLFLILTHECNLRCKYCIYSDNYPHTITYDNKNMTFDVAKKAVDSYIKLYKNKLVNGYRNNPIINFYGGEPLLQFKLIKKVVEYCKSYDYDFQFFITTNGVIMNDEIIKLLIDNNFRVTISLDGNKENHDRNRVSKDNKRTFEIIINNLKKLQQEKLKRGVSQPISFNCCYDDYSNMIDIIDFFNKNEKELNCSSVMFSEISPYDTYYSEYCQSMHEKGYLSNSSDTLKTTYNKLFNMYKNNLINNEELKMTMKFLFAPLFYTKNLPKGDQGLLGNACVPGGKIAVSPDGNFYLCEKMNEKYPIGNIETGLEWEKIENVITQYLDIKDKKCSDCNISRFCDVCYAHFSMNDCKDQMFNEQFCRDKKRYIPKILTSLYSLLEKNPKCLDADTYRVIDNSFTR